MTELRKYKGEAERSGGGFISPAEAKTCEPHLEEVSATDDRDIQPLVEAVRECREFIRWHRKGKPLLAKQARLEAALEPFDSREDTALSSPSETNSTRTSSDGTRLQELLEAVDAHRKEKAHGRTANMDLVDDRLYELADRLQLQANEETK